MSVVEEGSNKSVYTEFFTRILFIGIARHKNAENREFLKSHAEAGLL